ncbi:amino acid ABC transporter permease [Rhizobium leguminosarum]|uniref:amino acid ABC transporter permease n=1 Tax=Rhizobium leguminosarum TaxID=384 RepID=UPI001C949BEE|nr:amino acid ABC transporter permease [Rhizobium leguminosarum]MBY5761489.1 amino acid ABC transporter permease [Rhizobium leguminosarum]
MNSLSRLHASVFQGGGGVLRSMFSTWYNTLITLVLILLAYKAVPPLASWLVFDAVWSSPSAEACRTVGGACWAFIREKARFILFGFFPYAQQWRPFVAILLLIGLVLVSANRRCWKPWLLGLWPVVIAAVLAVMGGGFPGMTAVPTAQWGGLSLTLLLAVVGSAFAFPLGTLLALGRTSDMPLIRSMCVGYIEFVRGVPLITVLFMASVMLPLFMPAGVEIDAVLRALVGMTLFVAAYFAEVIRGGLLAIPKGQFEAVHALGLGYWAGMRLVVLPQVLRISVPPLTNTLIGLIKDSSLVAIIGLVDLLGASKRSLSDPEWLGFYREAYFFVALIYFVICFSVSRYSRSVEAQLSARQNH